MELIEAIILGIIQGLTEFLPISSSGHLEIGKALLDNHLDAQQSLLLSIILHFATALSTLVVFRKDIVNIFKGLFAFKWNQETQFVVKIGLSMIPATIIGLFFETQLEQLFDSQLLLVGAMLMVTALLLFLTDRIKNNSKQVSFTSAIIIGISEAVALLPGISRSGATISTSVFLGIDKTKAARFSFLMVIPLIFCKLIRDVSTGTLDFQNQQVGQLIAGFIAAFITGLFACTWMIKLVSRNKLSYFGIYCLGLGLTTVIIALTAY